MDRKQREYIIRKNASPALLEEIEGLLEMAIMEKWESVETLEDAFEDTSEKADTIPEWKALRTPCRKVEIALGRYVPMSQSEIGRTQVTSGTKWAFKLGGVAYRWA